MSEESQALLKEIRDRFDYCVAMWKDTRAEGLIDMKLVMGDSWDPLEKQARIDSNRPCLSLDEINQYTNQAINALRQNKRAIQVNPAKAGAAQESAEVRGNLIRSIEYKSRATDAYITAYENVINRGYGAFRVVTCYEGDETFEQKICIERIANPDTVYVDPDFKMADASDIEYGFVIESMPEQEFKARWPKAKVTSFSTEHAEAAPAWVQLGGADSGATNRIQVAEYWKSKKVKRELLLLQGSAEPVFADIYPEAKIQDSALVFPDGISMPIAKRRTVESRKVCQYITNGLEVLEENDWAGKYIPIVFMMGKEMWVDTGAGVKRVLQSLVRLARDPVKLYNYYRTTEAEVVGQTPKAPYIGVAGQFEGFESDWQDVNKRPIPYMQYNAIVEATGGQVLAPPQRTAYEPAIMALEAGAESARRAIQSSMAIANLPTAAQRLNEKSGVALERIAQQQSQGSFHFVDTYDRGVELCGRIVNDLLDEIYDTPGREETVRKPDDTYQTVRLHQVSKDDNGQDVYGMIEGEHDITISTGPHYQSEMDKVSDFADLLSQNQQIFPLIADLVVKLKQLGPVGDEIAKRLVPPEIQAQQDGQQPLPPQVQQMMQQAQQQTEALKAYAQELQKELETLKSGVLVKQMEMQSKERVAEMDNQTKLRIAELDNRTDKAIALLRAEIDSIKARAAMADKEADREAAAEKPEPQVQ